MCFTKCIISSADIDIRSVDYKSKKPGRISLSGGNEKLLVGRGLTIAKVAPDLTKLTDFMTFDTHTFEGAIHLVNFMKVKRVIFNICLKAYLFSAFNIILSR